MNRLRGIARAVRRFLTPPRPGNVILMYHRISDTDVDPWALCVSPERFAAHMKALVEVALPARVTEVLRTDVKLPNVAVTFDDGYADNLYATKPILESYGVPATVFVSTAFIGSTRGFWWDELETIFLSPGLLPAEELVLRIDNTWHRWRILAQDREYSEAAMARNRGWVAYRAEPPTSRHSVFKSVWRALRGLDPAARDHAIQDIRAWAGADGGADARPMNNMELQSLADGDLVEIGAHTVTHSRLSALTVDQQRSEIHDSKTQLERLLARPVRAFAYPFGDSGDYGRAAVNAVRQSGFEVACSTRPGTVHARSRPLELNRFQVEDWDGTHFSRWLTERLEGKA